ncbi:unnamed protein product, partial [Didymodactylos carnosus]
FENKLTSHNVSYVEYVQCYENSKYVPSSDTFLTERGVKLLREKHYSEIVNSENFILQNEKDFREGMQTGLSDAAGCPSDPSDSNALLIVNRTPCAKEGNKTNKTKSSTIAEVVDYNSGNSTINLLTPKLARSPTTIVPTIPTGQSSRQLFLERSLSPSAPLSVNETVFVSASSSNPNMTIKRGLHNPRNNLLSEVLDTQQHRLPVTAQYSDELVAAQNGDSDSFSSSMPELEGDIFNISEVLSALLHGVEENEKGNDDRQNTHSNNRTGIILPPNNRDIGKHPSCMVIIHVLLEE